MASPAWKKIASDRQREIKKETETDKELAKHLQDLNDFKQPSFNMAWNKIAASPKFELSNIMSEQKINQMFGISESEIKQETETDEAVAKRLQEQYDFEYCENLERENTQKTTITNPNSIQNYSDYENSDSDSFEYPSILQTKQKVRIDRSSFSKTIQSQLQKYSAEEEKGKKLKIFEKKDRSTVDHAFDDTTRKILYGLLNHNVLISFSGIVSVGKEAVVLQADLNEKLSEVFQEKYIYPDEDLPKNVCLKVYKTVMGEFRNRDKYIKEDFRFKKQFKNVNPVKLAHMWAEKECSNLKRLKKCGLPAPSCVMLRKHVLVMSCIGDDSWDTFIPAPKLADIFTKLNRKTKKSLFDQTVSIMKIMYQQANLVHSDLSEFNLLYKLSENKVYVIDVGQAVEPVHPKALTYLYRDVQNVAKFFAKKCGLECVKNVRKLFFEVTGDELALELGILKISENSYLDEESLKEFDGGEINTEMCLFLSAIEEKESRAAEHAENNRNRGDFKVIESLEIENWTNVE